METYLKAMGQVELGISQVLLGESVYIFIYFVFVHICVYVSICIHTRLCSSVSRFAV